MTRSFGLLLLVVSLAGAGALFALQNKAQGPTSAAVTQEEAQATAAAASTNFAQVDEVLQADFAQNGTYAGAELPVGSEVTVAKATQASYCLQMTVSGTLVHENGPGGSPQPGPC